MMIRNRLLSLLYRIAAFGIAVWTCVLVGAENQSLFFGYFSVQSQLITTIAFGLLIIFNFIDLLRHGIHGVPAGIWMPVSLAFLCYSFVTGTVGNVYAFFGLSYSLNVILVQIVVPILFLVDWILFEEKGTVKWWHAFYWMIFPSFYLAFIFIRPKIWPNTEFTLLGKTSLYPYDIIDPNAHGWTQVLLVSLAAVFAFFLVGLVLIFFNNLMAGRFRRRGPELKA
jgi:hypothetical protein